MNPDDTTRKLVDFATALRYADLSPSRNRGSQGPNREHLRSRSGGSRHGAGAHRIRACTCQRGAPASRIFGLARVDLAGDAGVRQFRDGAGPRHERHLRDRRRDPSCGRFPAALAVAERKAATGRRFCSRRPFSTKCNAASSKSCPTTIAAGTRRRSSRSVGARMRPAARTRP